MASSSSENIDIGSSLGPDVEKGPKSGEHDSLVEWDGHYHPANPHNWNPRYKCFVSAVLVLLPLVVNIGSSVMSGTLRSLEEEFDIGRPGDNYHVLATVAQNFYTILVCRLLSGGFGASSMAVTGGALTDVWSSTVSRGISLDLFVATAFIGPIIGPIIGDFITSSHLGWRLTMWVTLIAAYAFSVFAFITLPQTYGPVLLTQKAARLRFETKNWALRSKMEEDRQHSSLLPRTISPALGMSAPSETLSVWTLDSSSTDDASLLSRDGLFRSKGISPGYLLIIFEIEGCGTGGVLGWAVAVRRGRLSRAALRLRVKRELSLDLFEIRSLYYGFLSNRVASWLRNQARLQPLRPARN
ncbi:hypothetical protein BJX96DRAFT_172333 [Aspergillus floccosus]